MSVRPNIPPEPIELKKAMRGMMGSMGDEEKDWQSLVAWYGNRIPKYLWTQHGWKKELSKKGLRWQDFLGLLSGRTQEIIRWVNDEISWGSLIETIERDLKNSATTRRISTEQKTTTIDEY